MMIVIQKSMKIGKKPEKLTYMNYQKDEKEKWQNFYKEFEQYWLEKQDSEEF